jgi:hypothetical protein
MVFNTQLNSLHKNGETCHRMRAPEKVIINDIRTRSKIGQVLNNTVFGLSSTNLYFGAIWDKLCYLQ